MGHAYFGLAIVSLAIVLAACILGLNIQEAAEKIAKALEKNKN